MLNAEALVGINLVPFGQAAVAGLELTLGALLLMLSFILLIACAKVVNRGSAHSSAPTMEIATAAAPNSASKRIMTQLLAESFLLGLVGGGVGVYFAWDGIRAAFAVFPADLRTQFIEIGAEAMFPILVLLLSGRILLARRPILRIHHPNGNEAQKGENQNPVALPSAHPTVYRSRGSAYAP